MHTGVRLDHTRTLNALTLLKVKIGHETHRQTCAIRMQKKCISSLSISDLVLSPEFDQQQQNFEKIRKITFNIEKSSGFG